MRSMRLVLTIMMVLLVTAGFAQQRISGTVTSKTTGSPLAGVSVHAGKTTVATDSSGRFSIPAAVGETITLSFIGMQNLDYKVTAGSQNINLVMQDATTELNAVVVTGYKSERKVDLTGAVSVVNLSTVKNS